MRRLGLLLALALTTGGPVHAKGIHVGIGGWGLMPGPPAVGSFDVTLVAVRLESGQAVGHAHVHGGATGYVTQMVPAASSAQFWCISVVRTDISGANQKVNFYIRQAGDGTAPYFDQFGMYTGVGIDCTAMPQPPTTLRYLTKGDFRHY